MTEPGGVPVEEFQSYGPRHASGLLGHAAAERTLLAAWRSGRMPHAWLITGPKGIGKATLAFRFARHVLATAGWPAAASPPAEDRRWISMIPCFARWPGSAIPAF